MTNIVHTPMGEYDLDNLEASRVAHPIDPNLPPQWYYDYTLSCYVMTPENPLSGFFLSNGQRSFYAGCDIATLEPPKFAKIFGSSLVQSDIVQAFFERGENALYANPHGKLLYLFGHNPVGWDATTYGDYPYKKNVPPYNHAVWLLSLGVNPAGMYGSNWRARFGLLDPVPAPSTPKV